MTTASPEHALKPSYLKVTRGLLRAPSGNRFGDGRCLVADCLGALDDVEEFPPRFLVLLATVGFQPFGELLSGIQSELRARERKVPLVGCSVAIIQTEKDFIQNGALLICLASRFIRARVGVGKGALKHPKRAAASLVEQLELDPHDPNPDGNHFLLCFVPGFVKTKTDLKYKAPDIHAEIQKRTLGRIPTVGGAAGDRFKREKCWEFANHGVFRRSAVVALVESDVVFRIGMRHGLEGTRKIVYVEELADDGRRIVRLQRAGPNGLESRTPVEIIRQHEEEEPGTTVLFGDMTPEDEGDRIVLYPKRDKDPTDESVYVGRQLKPYLPLEILKANPEMLRGTAWKMMDETLRDGYIDPFHLSGVIAFPCAARYEFSDKVALDIPGALGELRKRFPDVPVGGGSVFGEIGVGKLGQNLMRNWTCTGLMLADQLPRRSMERLGYTALAEAGKRMAEAQSVDDVLELAMEGIGKAGFPGGMISLVFQDLRPDSYVVVARKAHSERWKRIIKPTIRRAWGRDILVLAAESQEPEFIPNAQTDDRCDKTAAKLAEVISFHVSPLICPEEQVTNGAAVQTPASPERVIGLLQVDLGDMSNLKSNQLPRHLKTLLQAFAGQVATALGRAIRIHELALSDLFDRAVAESLTRDTVDEAAQAFVDVLGEGESLLGTNMIHIRLRTPDGQGLRMVAGKGRYYEAARTERAVIDPDEQGPSSNTFRAKKPIWVNNIEEEDLGGQLIARQPQGALREALESIRSYVNLPIQRNHEDSPIGILNIAAPEPWFFSESRIRSMETLGQRLYFALKHAGRVEAEKSRAIQVESLLGQVKFLLGMTPHLGTGDLRTTLRENAERMAKTANADVLSFFLWDPHANALVLRGQFGWKEDRIGKARYTLKDDRIDEARFDLEQTTMTATVATWREPDRIPDLRDWKSERDQGPSQYETPMFGGRPTNVGCEVIGIPLQYQGLLGVMTMHNALRPDDPPSKFAITEKRLLRELANDMSAYIYATLKYEEALDDRRREQRLNKLIQSLLEPATNLAELAQRACDVVRTSYDLEASSLYLYDEQSSVLRLKGSAGFTRPGALPAEVDCESTVLGNVFRGGGAVRSRPTQPDQPVRDGVLRQAAALLPAGDVTSLLLLPLSDQLGPTAGVLLLWNIRNRDGEEHPWFTARDREEFERAAARIAAAVRSETVKHLRVAAQRTRAEKRLIYAGTIVGQMVHAVRHDMVNILADCRSLVEQAHDDEEKRRSARLLGNSQKLGRQIEEFLRLIDAGWESPPEETFSLYHLLEHVVEKAGEQADKGHVRLDLCPDPDVTVRGARARLVEAFLNIVQNAVAASPEEGSVTITADPDTTKQRVAVKIADRGPGVPAEEISGILEGFRQRGPSGQLSVGVFLARFVVEQHGGTLEFESSLGEGTTVTMTLPYLRLLEKESDHG